MQNIMLNNGNIVPIASTNDAIEVIRDNLGSELATYIEYVIDNFEFDAQDMESLERDNMSLSKENERLINIVSDLELEINRLKRKDGK